MRTVLFNALQGATSAGVGRYSLELIKAILKLDPPFKFEVAIDTSDVDNLREHCRKCDKLLIYNAQTIFRRILIEQLKLPLIHKNVDLIHYPDYAAPILSTGPKLVITVHDLSFVRLPDTFKWYKMLWKKMLLFASCFVARRIICVSYFTKNELIDFVSSSVAKIRVIRCGFTNFEEIFCGHDFEENVDCSAQYLLFVGTLEPRKNLNRMLMAFREVIDKGKPELQLVIAGKKGWLYKSIFDTVRELNLEDRVLFTDFISDKQLLTLYRNAIAFVYPSLYEGFGFPLLEAMTCGTPVITSNTSSLPEVAGDAAILVNPYAVDEIAEAIERLLNNRKLQEELRRKGFERIKKFSWRECAKHTLEVYKEILES